MELKGDYSFVPTQIGKNLVKDYITTLNEIKRTDNLRSCLDKLCTAFNLIKSSPALKSNKNLALWASEMIAVYRDLGDIYGEIYSKLEQDIKDKKVVAEDYWNWD